MNLLLSGASGFIGNYFQHHYSSKYTCNSFPFSKYNLDGLILDGIETIIHLAAVVHKPHTCKKEYFRINVHQTIEFAQKAKEAGIKHFVFMSTIAVYDSHLTFLNEDSSLKPVTLYGQSKLEAEKELLSLEDEFFKVAIIRAPMVYGENAPGNIQSLMKLINKVSVLPFGGIKNQRSFVYVGNLCAMIDAIIQTKKRGIFLASDDETLSTTTLIELIARAKHKKIVLLHVKLFERLLQWFKPAMYQRLFGSLIVDNTQTKERLNFKNPYSAEDGIRRMVQGDAQ